MASERSDSTRLPSPSSVILWALLFPPLPSLGYSKFRARKLTSRHNHLSLLSFPPLYYANTTAKHPLKTILALPTSFNFKPRMRRFRDTLLGSPAKLQQALEVTEWKQVKGYDKKARSQIVLREPKWVALEGCLQEGLQTSRTIFGSNSFKWDRNQRSFLVYSVEIHFPSPMLFQQPCQKLT